MKFNLMCTAMLATGIALIPVFCQAGAFVDVLDTPALISPRAAHSLLNGLAKAGNRLVAVGQRGHILISDDHGITWQQSEVPVSTDLTAVQFVNAADGWAVGHDGIILHSNDGGKSWARQLDGNMANKLMADAYLVRAAAHPEDQDLAQIAADVQRGLDSGPDKPFLDVWFDDTMHGFAVGAFNLIFVTCDGGQHWQPWLDHTDNSKGLHLYGIRRIGADLFVVGEQGLVMKLDDQTQRFRTIETPYKGSYFGLIGKPGAIVAFGLRGNVFRSIDGGNSWNKVETGLHIGMTAGTVSPDGNLLLVSQAGHVLISKDDGASFRLWKPAMAPASAIEMMDSQTTVMVGVRGVQPHTL